MNHRDIRVIPYNECWPTAFATEAYSLYEKLRPAIHCIHHVGSTAVPGLAAKPTLDIILAVKDISRFSSNDAVMAALGYHAKGEFGLAGRRFYVKGSPNPTHHVHAYPHDSPAITRHLAFRDYLIAHPEIAQAYGALKRRCATRCDNDITCYASGKHAFVTYHEKRALEAALFSNTAKA